MEGEELGKKGGRTRREGSERREGELYRREGSERREGE